MAPARNLPRLSSSLIRLNNSRDNAADHSPNKAACGAAGGDGGHVGGQVAGEEGQGAQVDHQLEVADEQRSRADGEAATTLFQHRDGHRRRPKVRDYRC